MLLRLVFTACVVSLISAAEEACVNTTELSALSSRIDELLSNRLMAVETALAELLARTETTAVTTPETTRVVTRPQATTTIPAATTESAVTDPDSTVAGPEVTAAAGPFTFISTSMRWTEARDHCRLLGGDLASVHNAQEEAQMRAAAPDATVAFWVGINDEDDDGEVAWSDASALDYPLRWGFNHPQKGECGALTSGDEFWWDVPCISAYPFVCRI